MSSAVRSMTMMSSETAIANGATTHKSPAMQKSPLRERIRLRARSALRRPRRKRTSSAPARLGRRRRLLVEDHYRVDPNDRSLLPGLPVADDDSLRDMHDFFNLIALVPVVVLNGLNWDWDILLDPDSRLTMQQAWKGEWFVPFFSITVGYFLADLLWVASVPSCVKSPGVIIQHHVATLLYLIIPYRFNEEGWLMGACLSVEVNTWLLIARRVFNREGLKPWVWNLGLFSVRIKLISVLFYVTWVGIRCLLYPSIWRVVWTLWYEPYRKKGIIANRYALALILHSVFCILNFKWTFDLVMSKCRAVRGRKAARVEKGL